MGGYNFTGQRNRTAPRQLEYTFFIAAKNADGDYSESTEVTIQHPGINKLILSDNDLTGFFNSIQIQLPTPQTVRSQTVYPEEETSEKKKILGYRIYIYEGESTDRDTMLDEAETRDYNIQEIDNETIVISGKSKTTYQIAVGCYDSAVHPNYNPSEYEDTISDFIEVSTSSIEPLDISEALIKPNELTETLNTPEEGIEEQITLMAGNYDENISGGIGLKYTDDPDLGKGVDVQVVAERFRVFKEDDLEGTALFAVGDIDGTSQIFLNADEVAIYSGFENATDDDDNSYDGLFELSDKGVQIDTPNFYLDKQGNAEFGGELKAAIGDFEGSITGGDINIGNDDFIVDSDGTLTANKGTFSGDVTSDGSVHADAISSVNSSAITIDDNTTIEGSLTVEDNTTLDGDLTIGGDAIFKGDLDGASGTFETLNGANGLVNIEEGFDSGEIKLRDDNGNLILELSVLGFQPYVELYDTNESMLASLRRIDEGDGDGYGGALALYDENENRTIDAVGLDGHFVAETKDFKINHPDPKKSEYKLFHTTVETNTPGDNIYRYEKHIKEEITFKLPSYFKYLNGNSQVFVTPSNSFGNGYGKIKGNNITVKVDKEGDYNILVIGTRLDIAAQNNWDGAERLKENTR